MAPFAPGDTALFDFAVTDLVTGDSFIVKQEELLMDTSAAFAPGDSGSAFERYENGPVLGLSGTAGPASSHAADRMSYSLSFDGFADALCNSNLRVSVDHVGDEFPVHASSHEQVTDAEGLVVVESVGCNRCRRILVGRGL